MMMGEGVILTVTAMETAMETVTAMAMGAAMVDSV